MALRDEANAVRVTAANVNDFVESRSLVHGEETDVFADVAYQDCNARLAINYTSTRVQLTEQVEKINACIRIRVEHRFCLLMQAVWTRECSL